MRNTTVLFGMTLWLSAITLHEPVDAFDAPAREVQLEQHAPHANASSSTLVEQVREATQAFRDMA